MRTIDEISWGEKVLVSPRYSTWTTGFPPWSTTLKGQDSASFLTTSSSNLRPIKRLITVRIQIPIVAIAAGCISLDIEDGVLRVHRSLILGGLTDQTLLSAEGDERGRREVTLLVGDDLDVGALIIGNTGVGSACHGNQSVARSIPVACLPRGHSPRSMPMAPS